MSTNTPKFEAKDRVVWSHKHGPRNARGSVMPEAAALAGDPAAKLGTVVGPHVAGKDDKGEDRVILNWFDVLLDGETAPRTLTGDELVKVAAE